MNELKTIVITVSTGRMFAVRWSGLGDDAELNKILASAGKFGGRVHTFAADDADAKTKAIEAHRMGCGL